MTGCTCAKYNPDTNRHLCSVTGDGCVYLIPNSKACAEEWGEGPDAVHDFEQSDTQKGE